MKTEKLLKYILTIAGILYDRETENLPEGTTTATAERLADIIEEITKEVKQ